MGIALTRGALVLVNGSKVGLVAKVIHAPGMPMYGIEYSDQSAAVQLNEIIWLWQVTPDDMKSLNYVGIFDKYLPLIVADLATKIANFNKAIDRMRIDPRP